MGPGVADSASGEFEPFRFAADDPLAAAHAAVAKWVEDAFDFLGRDGYSRDVPLKVLPSGQAMLDAAPDQAAQIVAAAAIQTCHWDRGVDLLHSQAEELSAHHSPLWPDVWGRRRQAVAVLFALMRRTLPFQRDHLLAILNWCSYENHLSTYFAPLAPIARALERYVQKNSPDDQLRQAMKQFAAKLRNSFDKEPKRLATTVEQLCSTNEAAQAVDEPPNSAKLPAPAAAPAGTVGVLEAVKRHFGMLDRDPATATTLIGPDRFALIDNSPLRAEHQLLSNLFDELILASDYYVPKLTNYPTGRALLALPTDAAGRLVLATAERHINRVVDPLPALAEANVTQARYAAVATAGALFSELTFSLPRPGFFDLLLYSAASRIHCPGKSMERIAELVSQVESHAVSEPLTEGERFVLWHFRASLVVGPEFGDSSPECQRLTRLIGDGARFFLVPGDAWCDALNGDLSAASTAQQRHWSALLKHALRATATRPSSKWLKTAAQLCDAIGADAVQQSLKRWLPLVSRGQSTGRLGRYAGDTRSTADIMNDENATCLRGLLWTIKALPNGGDLLREVGAVAVSAYKKVPGVGPRAVRVGNAAVFVLSEMASTEAVGQLAMLKVRVKFGSAQKEIEKAFNSAAAALGLPRDQIEEMGVPSYGLEEVGRRSETLGDYTAELSVNGTQAEIQWHDSHGKPLKAVPAKVKSEHAEDWKELQQSLKDIQSMLPAQRDRIDSLFLLQQSWPIDTWRERYLDHPLVGTIARRLIWCVDGEPSMFVGPQPTDRAGNEIKHGKTAEITLWHPVGRPLEEILGWRQRLEALAITQPFKQAHREVYLLTDAERNTHFYSNRYAAHVLRQHQFNALCAARGWKNKLRLMVDDSYLPPFKELPNWGLRAEFWVEGIGEDYGTDTNESGVYLRLVTDQVRFYRPDAAVNYVHASGGGYTTHAAGPGAGGINEPVPLEQVPPLVLSEVLRDVDLFVGVASVGNDPTWQDGGPQGRYREYWQSYSFGELSGTASTRKAVLERLVPRLKIGPQCSFSDRFLIVSGQKRTYKIHLGSGNILMEPNDQYLCIVPDAKSRAQQEDLFLPFEGDGTLSIIISKALLLADDYKIKDPTITRQIDVR